MYCKNCGAKLPKDKDYCLRCGGRNQLDVEKNFKQIESGAFQPNFPMKFHYFYLFLLFLSTMGSIYDIFVAGFSIWRVINVLLPLTLLVTLGNKKRLGYILLMVYTCYQIVMLIIVYILFLLMAFGISIFENNLVSIDLALGSATIFIAIFTSFVLIAIIILLSIRNYYQKRRIVFC